MNLKFVVLGFLADQPMHGYNLKRALSPAVPATQTVNDGVLYPLLARMEKEGLITGKLEKVGKAPARKVFRPTKSGRTAFRSWLASNEGEGDEVTYDFLLGHPFLAKCLFFEQLDAASVRDKFEAQLASSVEKLDSFEQIRKGMAERGVSEYRVRVLDLGIAQQRARVQWLKRMTTPSAGGVQRRRRKKAA